MRIPILTTFMLLVLACGGEPARQGESDTSTASEDPAAVDAASDAATDSRVDAEDAPDVGSDTSLRDVETGDTDRDDGQTLDTISDTDTNGGGDVALFDADISDGSLDGAGDSGMDGRWPVVIHVRDIWGQLLPDDSFTLRITDGELLVHESVDARSTVYTTDGGRWTFTISPDDGFDTVTGTLRVSGDGSVLLTSPDNERAGLAVTDRGPSGAPIVHVGVPHRWFASHAAPARRGNAVRLLFNGEEAWRHVDAGLRAADRYAHIAIWWWESDFELVRDEPFAPRAIREENTIMAALDATAAMTRVIVWDNIALGLLNTDSDIEDRGESADDRFEYMPEDNPTRDAFEWSFDAIDFGQRVDEATGSTSDSIRSVGPIALPIASRTVDPTDWPLGLSIAAPIASWHQKLIIVDGDEAWVSGMNIKVNDWDRSSHDVFDPRRMDIEASEASRRDVLAREDRPDHPPRRDYMAHVRGPVAGDVARVFAARWANLLDADAENAEASTPAPVDPIPAAVDTDVFAQFVTTMPVPWGQYGLLESHLNAIRSAEQFIFIEDQYWRAPILLDALVERMAATPDLRLVVITMPVNEWTDPGCEWTHRMHEALAARFGGRYHVLQLRSFATRDDGFIGDEINVEWADIIIHSKLMIVDDVFLSVGSGNKNNRGYLYEGEANLNVYDPVWVRQQRERLVENLLGVDEPPVRWIDALLARSRANDEVATRWDDEGGDLDLDGEPLPPGFTPIGFVHPLTFGTPDDCLIEGIGADVTAEPDPE